MEKLSLEAFETITADTLERLCAVATTLGWSGNDVTLAARFNEMRLEANTFLGPLEELWNWVDFIWLFRYM